jgi:hypothetical protein
MKAWWWWRRFGRGRGRGGGGSAPLSIESVLDGESDKRER